MSNGILSDYNQAGQRPTNVAIPKLFSDFHIEFQIHPIKGDIQKITDIDAVKQSVRHLVLTNYGDIPFHPEIGSNITSLLFENVDMFTGMALKTEILSVLEKYEKRIENINVEVYDSADTNGYKAVISYSIKNTSYSLNTEIYLKRLR